MAILARWRERLKADPFLRDSVLLWFSAQFGNAANLLFQLAMFRRLPVAEYGALMAVTGATLSAALPLESLRAAVARQIAAAAADGADVARLRRILARWTLGPTVAAAAIVVLGWAGADALAARWTLADRSLVPIGAAALAASLFPALLGGTLQGLRRFGWYAAIGPAFGFGRLAAASLLVFALSATAAPAAAGHALGIAGAALVGAFGVRAALGRPHAGSATASNASADAGYFLRGLPPLLAFGVLLNADTPLAKFGLNPDIAGAFARAATIARTIIFLPMPIAMAVFPRIAARVESAAERRWLERRAAIWTGAMGLGAAAGVCALAGPLWSFFAGRAPTSEETNLVRVLALAMAPLAGVWLQLNVLLAKGRWRAALWLLPLAAAYAAIALRPGATPGRIALALGFCAWASWPALALAGAAGSGCRCEGKTRGKRP